MSKGKSTFCILKSYGKIVSSLFEVKHIEEELKSLDNLLSRQDGEIRIVGGYRCLPSTYIDILS